MNKTALGVIALMTIMVSCKIRNQSSDVKHGQLKNIDYYKTTYLISIEPDVPLHICGQDAPIAIEIIKKWSQTIGRDINIKESCIPTTHLWTIIDVDGYDSENAKKHCEESSVTTAFMSIQRRQVVFCNPVSGERRYARMLHEWGHAFGLCDQVESWHETSKDLCDPNYSQEIVEESVMGGSFRLYQSPQPDDIKGMQALAQRIPAGWTTEPVLGGPLVDGTYDTFGATCRVNVTTVKEGIDNLLKLNCVNSDWKSAYTCVETNKYPLKCHYHRHQQDSNFYLMIHDNKSFTLHGKNNFDYRKD